MQYFRARSAGAFILGLRPHNTLYELFNVVDMKPIEGKAYIDLCDTVPPDKVGFQFLCTKPV